ncbi:MAG: sucrase ferredoxin [Chloroflexota bacterium]
MTVTKTKEKAFCNVAARELGLDPAGHAGSFNDAVLIETKLPWVRSIYQEAGALPQEAIDLMGLWMERYKETGVFGHRPLLLAPDKEYSQDGYRRVVFYDKPSDGTPFEAFSQREYLVPDEDLGLLLWALFEKPETLPEFDDYQVPMAQIARDVLVCTHGTIDVACAKFGYPLYKMLRDDFAGKPCYENLRVWRVSHFGGHVFAPTLMDMPTGHYWAYIGEEQAAQIVERSGDVSGLREHYRGWAGLDRGFTQAAERELWQQKGWSWFDAPKSGQVIGKDEQDDPQWADVQLTYIHDGVEEVYQAHVDIEKTIETHPSTDRDNLYAYPQYRVGPLSFVQGP